MPQEILSLNTELRKLRPAELYTLGQILNVSDSWKKLMAIIPRDNTSDVPKFNSEHFSLIEQAVQQQKRSAAEIFLQEWATMGRKRPTLGILLDFLVKTELFRAADYIAEDLLKGETPRRPEHGPAAVVDISEETIQKLIENNKFKDTHATDECVIFGSSAELIMVKEVHLPERAVNATPNSYFQSNVQSTKLAGETEYHCIKNSLNTDKQTESGASQISDLLKFDSSERNIVNRSKHTDNNIGRLKSAGHESKQVGFVYNKQEMSSSELPIIVNEFAEPKSVNQLKANVELQSEDLPLFLNNSISLGEHRNISQTRDTLSSNSNIIPQEMTSDNLPQILTCLPSNTFLINQISNNKSDKDSFNAQPVIGSQELPITVLEYQRD